MAIGPDDLNERLTEQRSRRCVARPGAVEAGRLRATRVVLAGVPNAGKSTLFNALLGRERASSPRPAARLATPSPRTRDRAPVRIALGRHRVHACGSCRPRRRARRGFFARSLGQSAARTEIERADVVAVRPDADFALGTTASDAPVLRVHQGRPSRRRGRRGACRLRHRRSEPGRLRRAIADARRVLAPATDADASAALLPRHRLACADAERARRRQCQRSTLRRRTPPC